MLPILAAINRLPWDTPKSPSAASQHATPLHERLLFPPLTYSAFQTLHTSSNSCFLSLGAAQHSSIPWLHFAPTPCITPSLAATKTSERARTSSLAYTPTSNKTLDVFPPFQPSVPSPPIFYLYTSENRRRLVIIETFQHTRHLCFLETLYTYLAFGNSGMG